MLPFVTRSGDADNQYFSDGLSEDLITTLTALPGLHVASRTSAFRFGGSELDIRDTGEKLKVACVLEGACIESQTAIAAPHLLAAHPLPSANPTVAMVRTVEAIPPRDQWKNHNGKF